MLDTQAKFDKYMLTKSAIRWQLISLREANLHEKQLTASSVQKIDGLDKRIATVSRGIKFGEASIFREQIIERLTVLTEIEADIKKKNYLKECDINKYVKLINRLHLENASDR